MFPKRVSRKILEIQKSSEEPPGDSRGTHSVKVSFTAVRLCLQRFYNKFLQEVSPKFWGNPHFLSKNFEILENFGKFWKFLEIFGNFWKFLEIFWKNVPAEKNFGNFWKFLQKFQKIVKS